MINGAHVLIFSKDADADRAFLRDVFELPHVDAGDGWLIFGLPPAETAVHPSDQNDMHQLSFTCEDIEKFVARMRELGVATDPVHEESWGQLTRLTLPGGGKLGVYQPRHARPRPTT